MWPFSKKKKVQKRSHQSVSRVGSASVRVSSIDFFGSYSESKNGEFLVGWSDSDRESGVGGFRQSGEGSYILAEHDEVTTFGKLQRPNDGKVANNGTFIINDWMFGEGLQGTFYAFHKNGKRLIKHRFSANLYNNGISEDGRYAVCQLANSDTEDGGTIAFFDLEQGILLWQKHPDSGWADSYQFNLERNELLLRYRELGHFRYSFEGEFLDKERWEVARIKHASAFELSLIAKDRLKECGENMSANDAEEILSLLNRAVHKGLDEYPNEKASVYRTIGEVKERTGNVEEAIQNYEKALALNPKVGVKRRLSALKKQKA